MKTTQFEHGRIRSWADLSIWLEQCRDGGWLFRGEWDPKFETLQPAVGHEGTIRRAPYSLGDERHAFEEFKRTARPYLSKEPRSEIEWMALAQHHGLPTRLLDWTSSLLVAAFFAAEKADARGDEDLGGGVIYCVRDIPEIDVEREGNDSLFALREVKTYYPPHLSPRITVQQSVFTVHPKPAQPFEHPTLQRWVLDYKACWNIKRNLSAAGISYSSLFPDIDGVCRQIAWRYKWGFFRAPFKPTEERRQNRSRAKR